MAEENLESLRRAAREIIKPDDQSTWELTWQKGITPWDAGDTQPSLKEAIESSGLDLPRSGRALVPGCGSGYDLQYISIALGLDTLGLEIAETAVKRANELIEKAKSACPQLTARVTNQDFFTFNPPESQRFDLVYDHTFFCAIPPPMRKNWGSQMSNLVKPGGYLITVVYPILPYVETGPPYYIRPEHFEELLSSDFIKVLDKVPDKSSPSHVGKERLLIWRRLQ
ncbi:hypothetical protein GALMADRAFT_246837 [Galerina marginata CBS 339.88]|uniref:Methyltransferase domain-containing protein n=1 Tax=Galerina marginata (strain CBS 339.88) TaxID=685588 RepID=A0A067SZY1_GALM3|nr:hypothetical protein GALMADRAFT_246837 [Galerina marginata CBS 339.88]